MDANVAAPAPGPTAPLPLRLLSDDRLARQVSSGNDRAFSLLYERHHQALYRYCRSLVGNETDAQDALQSAFTGALVALRAGRRDAPVKPWLFRIAHNESISLLRRRRPEQELAEHLHGAERSAYEVAEERSRLLALVADLRELPERQRGALVMRELSGLSHEDVAYALGISVGAAKQTVFEARRTLAEFAEGRAMGCEEIRRMVSDADRRVLRSRRVRAHLRQCSGCSAFAEAIPARRADLLALSPVLPAGAAAGLLAQITGAGPAHSSGATGIAAGAGGKLAGATISTKLLASGAVIITAAVGTTKVLHTLDSSGSGAQPARPVLHHAGSSARGTAVSSSVRHHRGAGRISATGASHRAHGQARAQGAAAGSAANAAAHDRGQSVAHAHHGRHLGAAHVKTTAHSHPTGNQSATHRRNSPPQHTTQSHQPTKPTTASQPPAGTKKTGGSSHKPLGPTSTPTTSTVTTPVTTVTSGSPTAPGGSSATGSGTP